MKNKREEIKFVSLEDSTKKKDEIGFVKLEDSIETKKDNLDDTFIISDFIKEEKKEEVNNEPPVIKNNKSNKIYLSYEIRILIYVLISVVLFISSLMLTLISISLKSRSNLTYNQTSNLDYKVELKENNYYKDKYLNKGMQYIASLINNINVSFNYNFKTSENLNYRYVYYVNADIDIVNSSDASKKIYTKSERITDNKIVVKENSNGFSINENVLIDYGKYNDLVKGFKSSFAIDANSKLTVSLCVEVMDEKGNLIKSANSDTMKIMVPLTEQMVNIGLDYKAVNNSNNASVYKEFRIANKVSFTVAIIFMIGSLISAGLLIRFLMKTRKKKSLYDIKLQKILKEYDRVIVNSRKILIEEGTIIELKSFEELLDARDNLEKPIVFYEIHKGQKSVFMLKGDKESYKYVLKESDLEKEMQSNK